MPLLTFEHVPLCLEAQSFDLYITPAHTAWFGPSSVKYILYITTIHVTTIVLLHKREQRKLSIHSS